MKEHAQYPDAYTRWLAAEIQGAVKPCQQSGCPLLFCSRFAFSAQACLKS